MIAIVDYGMGNLRSAQKGVQKVGYEATITDDPAVIDAADGVILPGVGAFKDCFEGLRDLNLVEPVRRAAWSGRPFLGICVGMQLMFEGSDEGDAPEGLGIFKGRVVRFPNGRETGFKVPHMGWNALSPVSERPNPLLEGLSANPFVYFVHSYYPAPEEPDVILAEAQHGVRFAAMCGRDKVFGVQFHPEKSQREGLALLQAFGRLTEETS
ncbi:MAG: imidazole glycerol phosphate synthase subunit HisH [Candidatus Hydrogenedentota bacterium]